MTPELFLEFIQSLLGSISSFLISTPVMYVWMCAIVVVLIKVFKTFIK